MNLNLHFWSAATVVCWSNIRSPLIAFQTILHSLPEFPLEISGVDPGTPGPCSAYQPLSLSLTLHANLTDLASSGLSSATTVLWSLLESFGPESPSKKRSVGDERDKNIP